MATAVKYLSNVAKSVKYAAVESLKEFNPVIIDGVETNKDVTKAIYTGIKNYKSITSKAAKSISKSQVAELAREAKHNIIEDLKNGTFYNRERESKSWDTAASNSNMMSGEEFDFSIDGDEDEDFSVADTIDMVGDKASNAVNQVLLKTSEYQVEATRQSTTRLLAQQAAMTSTLHGDLSVVNANISGLVKFNTEAMGTHIENSRLFYETQQNQMNEQTSILREMLDLQKSVFTPKTKSASSKVKPTDIFTSKGAINLADYFKYVQQNIKDNDNGMSDTLSMIGDMGMGKAMVANPLGMIATSIIKGKIPKVLKESMLEFNDAIAGSISTALVKLTHAKDSSSSVAQFLGNIFGLDLSTKSKLSTSSYNKDAVPWNGKDHKALTEVIPGLLSKIYSSVSGSKELIYDYESGRFTDRKELKKQFDSARNRYVASANEQIIPELEKQISRVKFNDQAHKDQFMKDLDTIMKQNFDKMKYFNPNDKSLSARTYGLKGDMSEYNFKLIQEMYKKISPAKQLKANQDLIEAVQNQNDYLKRLEESGDSAFMRLFDGSDEQAVKKSPMFTASEKLDTTNNILSQILEAISGRKRKGKPKKGKAKQSKSNNTTTNDTTTVQSENYTSDLGIRPTTLPDDTEAAMVYGEDIDLTEEDAPSAYLAGIKKANTATGKLKAMMKGVNTLAQQPAKFIGNVLKKVDTRLYHLLFGMGSQDESSITSKIMNGFNDWFDDLKKNAKEKFKSLSDAISESGLNNKAKKIFSTLFGVDVDAWTSQFKDAMFGDKDKSFVSGMKDVFSQGFRDIWGGIKKAFSKGKDFTDENIKGVLNEQGQQTAAHNSMLDELEKTTRRAKNIRDRVAANRNRQDGTGEVEVDGNAASGMKRVSKTGVIAVSEGEFILPPDLNPYNVSNRNRKEQSAISRFNNSYKNLGHIKGFAKGGSVKGEGFTMNDSNQSNDIDNEIRIVISMLNNGSISVEQALSYIARSYKRGNKNAIKDAIKHADESVLDDLYSAIENKRNKERKNLTRDDYVEGKESFGIRFTDEIKELCKSIMDTEFAKNVSSKLDSAMKGKGKEGKDAAKDVLSNFSNYLPRIAAGGVAGMGLSLMLGLAGGPLLGGAVGASLGLLSKSNKLQTWLFGKEITDEDGNTSRDGSGVISKNIVQNINKYFPNMAKGAVVGGITSLLPFIPGGPMAGILVGSAVGFARSNEAISSQLFGEGKALSKMKEKVGKMLPKMAIGAGAMALGGPFGLTTNLILGAGLGFVSDTEKFKDIVFGTKGVDGKRYGGLVGFIKDATEIPLRGIKKLFDDTRVWLKDEILAPIKKGINPFIQQIQNIGTWLGDKIHDSINTHIIRPIGYNLNRILIRPLESFANRIFGGIFGAVRKVIASPFKLFGALMGKLEERQLGDIGGSSNMSLNDRIARRREIDQSKGRRRDWINQKLGVNLFNMDKIRGKAKLQNSDAQALDEYLANADENDVLEFQRLQMSIDSATGKKVSAKKLNKHFFASTGLDGLLKAELEGKFISKRDYNNLMTATRNNDFDTAIEIAKVAYNNTDPQRSDLLIDRLKKAKKDRDELEKVWNESESKYNALRERTGIRDIASRAAKRTVRSAIRERFGITGTPSPLGAESEQEAESNDNRTTANTVEYATTKITDELTSIRDILEDIAYPKSKKAKRRKKERESAEKEEQRQLPVVTSPGDIVAIAQSGDISTAQQIARGGNVRPSRIKTMFTRLLNNTRRRLSRSTSVMTEHGIVKLRTNAQGEQIPDTRDSETNDTLERQQENANTQKGILSKITGIGSKITSFFTGEDDSDDTEKHKSSLLKNILGIGKGALSFLGSKGGLILGGLGLTALAGTKVKVKKKDANGNLMQDANGNQIYEEKLLIDAVGGVVKKVWLGEDGQSGIWGHIKGFANDTLIPAFERGVNWLVSDGIPTLVEALVERLPNIIISAIKGAKDGVVNTVKRFVGLDDKGGRGNTPSSNSIQKNYTVTLAKNRTFSATNNTGSTSTQNSIGGSIIKSNSPAFSATPSSGGTANAYYNGGSTVNQSTTTTANIATSPTIKFSKSTPNYKPTKNADDDTVDEILNSKGYQNAPYPVQEKILEDLVPIWNTNIEQLGMTVKDLLNDDSTLMFDVTDPDTGQTITIPGALTLCYPQAANLIGLDILLTDEERSKYSKQLGYTQNRGALMMGVHGVTKALLLNGHGGAGIKLYTKFNNIAFDKLSKIPIFRKSRIYRSSVKAAGMVKNAPAYAAKGVSDFIKNYNKTGSAKDAVQNMYKDWSENKAKQAAKQAAKKEKKGLISRISNSAKNAYHYVKDAGGITNAVKKKAGSVVDSVKNVGNTRSAKRAAKRQAEAGIIDELRASDYGRKPKAPDMSFGVDDIDILDADGNVLSAGSKAADDVTSTAVERIAANGTTELADDVVEGATKSARKGKKNGILSKATEWVSSALHKFFKDSKVVKKIQSALQRGAGIKNMAERRLAGMLAEFADKLTQKFTKGLAKSAAKAVAKVSTKLSAAIASGMLTTIVFAVTDFLMGFKNADAIMGVSKPNMLERVIAGIVNAITENLLFGIIPADTIVSIFSKLLESLGVNMDDYRQRQAEAEEEVRLYNEQNGTNLTTYEYFMKDKIETKVKNFVSKVWNSRPMSMVKGSVGVVTNAVGGAAKGLWSAGKGVVTGVGSAIGGVAKGVGNLITGHPIKAIKSVAGGIIDGGKKIVGGIIDGGKKVVGGVIDGGKSFVNGISNFFTGKKVFGSDEENNEEQNQEQADENISTVDQVNEAANDQMTSADNLVYDASGNVVGSGVDENGNIKSMYIPQGDETEDNASRAISGNGDIISDENRNAINQASAEINATIPNMIRQLKLNLSKYFGLDASELNKTTMVGAAKYNVSNNGPKAFISKITSMWKNIATKVSPMTTALPKTLASGMKGLSRFLAVNFGFADPKDKNADMSKVMDNQAYMDQRAEEIAQNSPLYGMGISNSTTETTPSNTSNTTKTIGGAIAGAIKKIFGGGSGSGLSGAGNYKMADDSDPSVTSFISQKYSGYANKSFTAMGDDSRTTVADAGCAPAAATMAINTMGAVTPISMDNAMQTALKYKQPNGGVTADYFIDEFNRHGLNSAFVTNGSSNKEKTIINQLKQGNPVILMGNDSKNTSKAKSPFGPTDHYVVATGISKDNNTIYINDPEARRPKLAYATSKILKSSKLGIIPLLKNGRKAASSTVEKVKRTLRAFSGKAVGDMLYVGDSRTVGMEAAVGSSSKLKFIGKVSMGLSWLKSTASSQAKSIIKSTPDIAVIFAFGVNDLYNIDNYISYYTTFKNESGSNNIWYMAVNPVSGGSVTNDDIEKFNSKLKDFAGSRYIDTYTYLKNEGFKATDGIHYDNETYQKIHKFVSSAIGGASTITDSTGSDVDTTSIVSSLDNLQVKSISDLIGTFDSLAAAYGLSGSSSSGSTITSSDSSSSTTVNTDGISGPVSTNQEIAKKQIAVVARMKSVEGKLKYAQNNAKYPGSRNPDDGSGDCSSTVQWAYQKETGVDVGDWTGAQNDSSATYFIDQPHSARTFDESKLQLGDLLLYGDNAGGHVELYYGNGQTIGHGSGYGPKIKPITSRTKDQWSAKRLNQFKGSGSGLEFTSQLDSKYANLKLGNDSVADSGCAPAVAVMAENAYKNKYDQAANMQDMVRRATPYKISGSGVTADFFVDEFDRKGYSSMILSNPNAIYNSLLQNKPVVLLGQDENNRTKTNSPFGPNAHYVLATRISPDGKIIYVNDPEASKGEIPYKAKSLTAGVQLGIRPILKGANKKVDSMMAKVRNILRGVRGKGKYGSDTVQYKVWNGLRADGYSEIATAAAMGNIQWESGFRPEAIEAGSGAGFGLVQWTGGRRTAIETYASQHGKNLNSVEFQVEYLLIELKPDSGVWTTGDSRYDGTTYHRSDWTDGKDIGKATAAFMACFERPQYDRATNHLDNRIEASKEYYTEFTGQPIDSSILTNTTNNGISQGGNASAGGTSKIMELLNTFDDLAAAYGLTSGSDISSTDSSSVSGETLSSSGSTTGSDNYPKYTLTDSQITDVATCITGETGGKDEVAARQEASQMVNLNEVTYGKDATADNLSKTIHGNWYAKASWKRGVTDIAKQAVKDVIVGGKRTLPRYVTEHDTFPLDIVNAKSRDAYSKGDPVKNRYGSNYKFYDFFGSDKKGDISGYFKKDYDKYKDDQPWSGSGSGLVFSKRAINTVSLGGRGSSVQTSTRANTTPVYSYESIQNRPVNITTNKSTSTNDGNINKLLGVLIKLLTQVVTNTSSIKEIATLVVKLVDLQSVLNSPNSDNTEIAKDLATTKALVLNAIKQSTESNSQDSIQQLIRNVEAIAAQ